MLPLFHYFAIKTISLLSNSHRQTVLRRSRFKPRILISLFSPIPVQRAF